MIYTDRSRIEIFEHCPRKRYHLIEYQGTGLEKAGDLKLDARIGTWTHNGIESYMGAVPSSRDAKSAAIAAGEQFLTECQSLLPEPIPQQVADVNEGASIVTALVYAWLKVKAPRLLADGEVLGIEKELTVDFPVATTAGSETVRLMARSDIIWRRHQDGTIFIRNLKTVRKADDRWREKWGLDMQTLSEPLAVDEWLANNGDTYHSDDGQLLTCGGVIIDGLVTGEVLFDKYRGLFYHNNPLIYCWERGDIGIVDHPEFYPRYEWSCSGPHKYANGRKCEGGKTHKLSGVRKVPVADRYPGGIIAWVDYLSENDPALIEEMLIELPPIIRSEYQIERWKRQVLPREVKIKLWAKQIDSFTGEGLRDEMLDKRFPMHTAGGNCLYPGKCAAFSLCHGSAASDPLNSGFVKRVPNHPQEKEVKGE